MGFVFMMDMIKPELYFRKETFILMAKKAWGGLDCR